MSATIITTGSNSRQIIVDNEYHPAQANGVIDKINTCITDLGWTLFDTVTSTEPPAGARITDKCFTTKVYSAPCNDGGTPSTKYIILRFDAPRQYFYMSCAESWNDTTHVATNECWTQNRGFPIPLGTGHYVLYIFASARYCVMVPVIRGEPGLWQGVFEFEREDYNDDYTKAPCFGYTNGVIFGSPFYALTNGMPGGAVLEAATLVRNHNLPFWIPRLPTGEVGLAAIKNTAIIAGTDSFPPPVVTFNSNNFLSNTSLAGYGFGVGALTTVTTKYRSGANTNSAPIYSVKLGPQNSNSFFSTGRVYGINLSGLTFNDTLDTVTIPSNSTTKLFSPTGSNATHYVLGITGGPMQTVSTNPAGITTEKLKFDYIDSEYAPANTEHFYDGVVVRGRYVYLTCGNTTVGYPILKKYDLDTNNWTTISLPGQGDSLVYDGGNNIYVSTSTGLSQVNIDNNSIANLDMSSNLAGGAAALAIDDRYVYAAQRTASIANSQLAVVNSSFLVERYINGLNVGNTSALSRYGIVFSPDYDDNKVVLINTQQQSSYVNLRNFIVSGANGTTLHSNLVTAAAGYSAAAGNTNTSSSYYYDNNYIFVKHNTSYNQSVGTTTSGLAQQFILFTSNVGFITANTLHNRDQTPGRESGDGAASQAGVAPFKIREAIPFKGYRLSNGHRGGQTTTASESFFISNYDHFGETTLNVGISSSNNLHGTLPSRLAGCCFSDGIWYYRFANNQSNGISKVYGQYRTKNNNGLTTPTILITS
jgi:hypothetical protein